MPGRTSSNHVPEAHQSVLGAACCNKHWVPVIQMAAAVQASAASADIIGTEVPCRVKLRLWRWGTQAPKVTRGGHSGSSAGGGLALEAALLTIPDAVLCSEMGVHFSPCGRLLAACVACPPQVRTPLSTASTASIRHVLFHGVTRWLCHSRCDLLHCNFLHYCISQLVIKHRVRAQVCMHLQHALYSPRKHPCVTFSLSHYAHMQ